MYQSYDVQELVRGTPLEEWYMGNKETIEGGQNFRQHLSDILRTVLIWKKGKSKSQMKKKSCVTLPFAHLYPTVYVGTTTEHDIILIESWCSRKQGACI